MDHELGSGCRWCGAEDFEVLLDLGPQGSVSYLPMAGDPGPDASAPLRLVVCRQCLLAQLARGVVDAEGPMGIDPRPMREQATAVLRDLGRAGLVRPGASVVEFSSPHSGDWSHALDTYGLCRAEGPMADLVLDVFGIMHEPEQYAALTQRVARLREGGTLVLQIHGLAGDIERDAWHVVRHGHYAYYTVSVLVDLLSGLGLSAVEAWEYPLQGGTTVLAFRRGGVRSGRVTALLERERDGGLTAADSLLARSGGLRTAVADSGSALRRYLDQCRADGLTVGAYPASTGVVTLLASAGVTRDDLIAVGDIAPDKQGRCLPGSRIPIVEPDELIGRTPDRVLLFVPDLLDELREQYSDFERTGRWVVVAPYPEEVRGASQPTGAYGPVAP